MKNLTREELRHCRNGKNDSIDLDRVLEVAYRREFQQEEKESLLKVYFREYKIVNVQALVHDKYGYDKSRDIGPILFEDFSGVVFADENLKHLPFLLENIGDADPTKTATTIVSILDHMPRDAIKTIEPFVRGDWTPFKDNVTVRNAWYRAVFHKTTPADWSGNLETSRGSDSWSSSEPELAATKLPLSSQYASDLEYDFENLMIQLGDDEAESCEWLDALVEQLAGQEGTFTTIDDKLLEKTQRRVGNSIYMSHRLFQMILLNSFKRYSEIETELKTESKTRPKNIAGAKQELRIDLDEIDLDEIELDEKAKAKAKEKEKYRKLLQIIAITAINADKQCNKGHDQLRVGLIKAMLLLHSGKQIKWLYQLLNHQPWLAASVKLIVSTQGQGIGERVDLSRVNLKHLELILAADPEHYRLLKGRVEVVNEEEDEIQEDDNIQEFDVPDIRQTFLNYCAYYEYYPHVLASLVKIIIDEHVESIMAAQIGRNLHVPEALESVKRHVAKHHSGTTLEKDLCDQTAYDPVEEPDWLGLVPDDGDDLEKLLKVLEIWRGQRVDGVEIAYLDFDDPAAESLLERLNLPTDNHAGIMLRSAGKDNLQEQDKSTRDCLSHRYSVIERSLQVLRALCHVLEKVNPDDHDTVNSSLRGEFKKFIQQVLAERYQEPGKYFKVLRGYEKGINTQFLNVMYEQGLVAESDNVTELLSAYRFNAGLLDERYIIVNEAEHKEPQKNKRVVYSISAPMTSLTDEQKNQAHVNQVADIGTDGLSILNTCFSEQRKADMRARSAQTRRTNQVGLPNPYVVTQRVFEVDKGDNWIEIKKTEAPLFVRGGTSVPLGEKDKKVQLKQTIENYQQAGKACQTLLGQENTLEVVSVLLTTKFPNNNEDTIFEVVKKSGTPFHYVPQNGIPEVFSLSDIPDRHTQQQNMLDSFKYCRDVFKTHYDEAWRWFETALVHRNSRDKSAAATIEKLEARAQKAVRAAAVAYALIRLGDIPVIQCASGQDRTGLVVELLLRLFLAMQLDCKNFLDDDSIVSILRDGMHEPAFNATYHAAGSSGMKRKSVPKGLFPAAFRGHDSNKELSGTNKHAPYMSSVEKKYDELNVHNINTFMHEVMNAFPAHVNACPDETKQAIWRLVCERPDLQRDLLTSGRLEELNADSQKALGKVLCEEAGKYAQKVDHVIDRVVSIIQNIDEASICGQLMSICLRIMHLNSDLSAKDYTQFMAACISFLNAGGRDDDFIKVTLTYVDDKTWRKLAEDGKILEGLPELLKEHEKASHYLIQNLTKTTDLRNAFVTRELVPTERRPYRNDAHWTPVNWNLLQDLPEHSRAAVFQQLLTWQGEWRFARTLSFKTWFTRLMLANMTLFMVSSKLPEWTFRHFNGHLWYDWQTFFNWQITPAIMGLETALLSARLAYAHSFTLRSRLPRLLGQGIMNHSLTRTLYAVTLAPATVLRFALMCLWFALMCLWDALKSAYSLVYPYQPQQNDVPELGEQQEVFTIDLLADALDADPEHTLQMDELTAVLEGEDSLESKQNLLTLVMQATVGGTVTYLCEWLGVPWLRSCLPQPMAQFQEHFIQAKEGKTAWQDFVNARPKLLYQMFENLVKYRCTAPVIADYLQGIEGLSANAQQIFIDGLRAGNLALQPAVFIALAAVLPQQHQALVDFFNAGNNVLFIDTAEELRDLLASLSAENQYQLMNGWNALPDCVNRRTFHTILTVFKEPDADDATQQTAKDLFLEKFTTQGTSPFLSDRQKNAIHNDGFIYALLDDSSLLDVYLADQAHFSSLLLVLEQDLERVGNLLGEIDHKRLDGLLKKGYKKILSDVNEPLRVALLVKWITEGRIETFDRATVRWLASELSRLAVIYPGELKATIDLFTNHVTSNKIQGIDIAVLFPQHETKWMNSSNRLALSSAFHATPKTVKEFILLTWAGGPFDMTDDSLKNAGLHEPGALFGYINHILQAKRLPDSNFEEDYLPRLAKMLLLIAAHQTKRRYYSMLSQDELAKCLQNESLVKAILRVPECFDTDAVKAIWDNYPGGIVALHQQFSQEIYAGQIFSAEDQDIWARCCKFVNCVGQTAKNGRFNCVKAFLEEGLENLQVAWDYSSINTDYRGEILQVLASNGNDGFDTRNFTNPEAKKTLIDKRLHAHCQQLIICGNQRNGLRHAKFISAVEDNDLQDFFCGDNNTIAKSVYTQLGILKNTLDTNEIYGGLYDKLTRLRGSHAQARSPTQEMSRVGVFSSSGPRQQNGRGAPKVTVHGGAFVR